MLHKSDWSGLVWPLLLKGFLLSITDNGDVLALCRIRRDYIMQQLLKRLLLANDASILYLCTDESTIEQFFIYPFASHPSLGRIDRFRLLL